MKYVGDLISDARSDTNNTDLVSIPSADFIRYLNYGQDRLFGLILQTSPNSFQKEVIIPLVAGQESYEIPDRLYLERIVQVEFSPTSEVRDYYKIYEVSLARRSSYPGLYPRNYMRRDGILLLTPVPDSAVGSLRVTYERDLDEIELRRGRVNGTPSGAIVDLTSSTFGAPSTADEALFVENAYVCISDAFGTVMLRNGLISSYNAASDEVTLAANVSTYLVTGYTLANLANGYLTVGKYTTTHSKLRDPCERYLIAYANWKILARDAATAAKALPYEKEKNQIELELVESYGHPDKDDETIQVENPDLMLQ